MENLEGRTLMASVVESIIADNRGKVLVILNPGGGTIDTTTINKSSAILYTAGPDNLLNTLDDVRERESVVFQSSINRITINSKLKAGTGYRIRLSGARIKTLANEQLDGDGNGVPGGDYNVQTKNEKGPTPTVRMNTSLGTVVLRLNLTAAPKTAAYFMGRANASFYDGVMVTKSVTGTDGGVGAGSIKISQLNEYEVTPIGAGKAPEATGLTNTRGTISMERITIDATKEGNGFFFNTSNNTTSNKTVFGTVRSGLAVVDAINNLTEISLAPEHSFVLVDTSKVPILSPATSATFSPNTHAVLIHRTAVQMRVVGF
ncbi:MAG: peptidylprolyl isomerase [Anaerolineae bacterium]|nr:peptidylprolyl isomerase [Phycisphaerae bacterium]